MLDGLNQAELLPGGPGWVDVQYSLKHGVLGSDLPGVLEIEVER